MTEQEARQAIREFAKDIKDIATKVEQRLIDEDEFLIRVADGAAILAIQTGPSPTDNTTMH